MSIQSEKMAEMIFTMLFTMIFMMLYKSFKVLMMMMKAAKLGWAGAGAGQEWNRSRIWTGAVQGYARSRAGAGTG